MGHSSTIALPAGERNDAKAQTELLHDGKLGSCFVPLAMTFDELLGGSDMSDETADDIPKRKAPSSVPGAFF
jgi:hypothetical protein